MPWKVQSTVSGGIKLTKAQSKAYSNTARKLCSFANELSSLSASWQHAAMVIANQISSLEKAGGTTKYTNSQPFASQHAKSSLTPGECMLYANECKQISNNLEQLSEIIIRANNIYEDAEVQAKENFDNKIALMTAIAPITSLPFFVSAAFAVLEDSMEHSGFKHFAKWSNATRHIQQGTIRGLSQNMMINPITGLPIFTLGAVQNSRGKKIKIDKFNKFGLKKKIITNKLLNNIKRNIQSPVPFVSGALSLGTAALNNRIQGNTLRVTRISQPWKKAKFVLPKPGRNLSEALDNLTELGRGNLSVRPPLVNPDAATIAIQRFKRADGKTSWMVTIPGTDGKAHSPFGWEQNLEVMSNTPLARKQADSTRMVIEAMERSGIQSKDPVVLVGHSQGGIVAASIASDYSKKYNIKHIVTAGSPIANHPIPKRTWVTSIEMEDELVPSLDGKENPMRNNWVTIRGKATHVQETPRPLPPYAMRFSGRIPEKKKFDRKGIFVEEVPEEGTLTHDLHYHKAAYADAMQLGSKSVIAQDQHFQKIIDGELQSTTLWQGVME